MNTQHTPGPWRVLPRRNVWWQIQSVDSVDDNEYLAEVENDPDAPDESEANAHLIAAAPELLAVLEDLVRIEEVAEDKQHFDRLILDHGIFSKARAAIAKAEGHSSKKRGYLGATPWGEIDDSP